MDNLNLVENELEFFDALDSLDGLSQNSDNSHMDTNLCNNSLFPISNQVKSITDQNHIPISSSNTNIADQIIENAINPSTSHRMDTSESSNHKSELNVDKSDTTVNISLQPHHTFQVSL